MPYSKSDCEELLYKVNYMNCIEIQTGVELMTPDYVSEFYSNLVDNPYDAIYWLHYDERNEMIKVYGPNTLHHNIQYAKNAAKDKDWEYTV